MKNLIAIATLAALATFSLVAQPQRGQQQGAPPPQGVGAASSIIDANAPCGVGNHNLIGFSG